MRKLQEIVIKNIWIILTIISIVIGSYFTLKATVKDLDKTKIIIENIEIDYNKFKLNTTEKITEVTVKQKENNESILKSLDRIENKIDKIEVIWKLKN